MSGQRKNFSWRAALILFCAAFILLVANLLVSLYSEDEPAKPGRILTANDVDSLFIRSLFNFGLPGESISKRRSSKVEFSYKIKIPVDLSIPVVLTEINQNFARSNVLIQSTEVSFHGLTKIGIILNEKKVLFAELNYDPDIKRKAGRLAFIIDEFRLDDSEDSLLLDIPETFSVLIMPRTKSIDVIKFLQIKNKTYSLLLNDDIPELKYKLNKDYTEKRLSGPLLSILRDFSGAATIFIDNNSDLYNSSSYNFIRNELFKRKINLYLLGSLSLLENDEDELISGFGDIIKNSSAGDGVIIRVNQEGFRILYPEIRKFKKLGYKIVHPTELL